MQIVTAKIRGISPYSQSRPPSSPKETGESHDSYDLRIWRERMHVNKDGIVFIPPMAIKNMLPECAKFLGETIRGKGKATWTKHFQAGLLVTDEIQIGVRADDVTHERLFLPSDGKSGSGSRVWKHYPYIPEGWEASVTIYVIDPQITSDLDSNKGDYSKSALYRHLVHAGKFIGIGRFRPRNNGFYGRFDLLSFDVKAVD